MGIEWAAWRFEASVPSGGGGDPEDELLCGKVGAVAQHFRQIAAEPDCDRPIEGDTDRDPSLDGRCGSVSPLEMTDLGLAQADPSTKRRLREMAARSRTSRFASERRRDGCSFAD